jgi:hypothetical protein
MSLETKILDNFVYESVLDHSVSDSDKTPFTNKSLTYVLDNQAGNSAYTSGQVIIDASSMASSGTTFQDWSNAYVVIPFNVKLEATAVIAATAASPINGALQSFLTSVKNNSIIDSITVEQNGRTIVNQTSNLSQFVNYKMHSTMSQDSVAKMGASLMYTPDGVGAYTYTASTVGVDNTDNLPTATSNWNKPEAFNSGALARQSKLFPYTTALTTQQKQINEADVTQIATAFVPITTAANVVMSDVHFLATIRLRDICPYFESHPKLTRGLGYRIILRLNQGVTTFTHVAPTAGLTPFTTLAITAQSFTPIGSCLAQPSMVHVGLNTISTLLEWPTNVTISASSLKLTSQVDVGSNALLNGIRLYCPSYTASPEAQSTLMRQPVLNKPFVDLYHNVIQNQLAGNYINTQLASGISNPKFLIVCPQIAQAVNSFNSQGSALNPCPGVTDPQLSLTGIQIKVGSEYVLPDRVNYDFIQFLEQTSTMFGLNANQTNAMSSGIIDFQKFRHNYRYYVFDLSRYLDSQDNVPRMITLETFNNSNVAVDLYCYCGYERSAEFDLQKGAVQVE